MGKWNYRRVREGESYSIREVHYDNLGYPWGWTDASAPFGETLDELKTDLRYMVDALSEPVLVVDGDNIVGEE